MTEAAGAAVAPEAKAASQRRVSPTDQATPTGRKRVPGRIFGILQNASWILAGKSVSGILGLMYLALAANALGLEGFGKFVLILAFGQLVSNLAQFQTADVLIRFGAIHLNAGRAPGVTKVISFAAWLDVISGVICVVLALVGAFGFGELLGLPIEDQMLAAAFGAALLFSLRGTPVGLLRLLDRFDVAAFAETAIPALRLVGAVVCYLAARDVAWFLLAWVIAHLVTTIIVWWAAVRQFHRQGHQWSGGFTVRGVTDENPGLWRFAWFTNFTASVSVLRQQANTLLVGWAVGTVAAGAYRVSQQLAQALSKPVVALSRAVYPDLAHVSAARGPAAVSALSWKLSVLGLAVGAVALLLVALVGEWLLALIGGERYAEATTLLFILTAAAAVEMWGFGQEPALLALGRSGVVLIVRAVATVLAIGLALALMPAFGAAGAAVATLIGNLSARLAMTVALWRYTRADTRTPAAAAKFDALDPQRLNRHLADAAAPDPRRPEGGEQ